MSWHRALVLRRRLVQYLSMQFASARNRHVHQATTEYLTAELVEREYPGLTRRRLARLRAARSAPQYFKTGKLILYRRCDIEAFLATALVTDDTRGL
jgi:hypothetical protein